jgi:PD-(D/E)XK nuclease superfamily protein
VSISPVNLLPKDANGISFQLKKVDTGLFLKPNPFVSTKIDRKLMMLPVEEQSINQTATASIRSRPLLASFKLKRTTPATDPLVQLGIWSAALSERLRKLQRPEDKESDLMAIPAITVVGHVWTLYYSYVYNRGR